MQGKAVSTCADTEVSVTGSDKMEWSLFILPVLKKVLKLNAIYLSESIEACCNQEWRTLQLAAHFYPQWKTVNIFKINLNRMLALKMFC